MVGLSDDDVKRQIEHMVAFINQEASEKVQEIEAKAEEEFNIEKGRLVQQERLRILNFYEKKEKHLSLLKKILHSQCQNKSRIEILKYQDDILQNLLKEAKNKLSSLSNDSDSYKKLLFHLIMQALYQIMESEVVIVCRKSDVELVKTLLSDCQRIYDELEKGAKSTLRVDEDHFLDPDCSGGVEVATPDGRIKVDNSLDKRLDQASRQIMPKLRTTLFGVNKNRRFNE